MPPPGCPRGGVCRAELPVAQLCEGYLSEARKSFRTWRRLRIDWCSEFPEELRGKDVSALDTVADLMSLDGVLLTAYNPSLRQASHPALLLLC